MLLCFPRTERTNSVGLIDQWELERPISISEVKQVADPSNEIEIDS